VKSRPKRYPEKKPKKCVSALNWHALLTGSVLFLCFEFSIMLLSLKL
jgi:hypothetical protein